MKQHGQRHGGGKRPGMLILLLLQYKVNRAEVAGDKHTEVERGEITEELNSMTQPYHGEHD